MNPIQIEHLPWPELAEVCVQSRGLVLLPLGATEQHGPHLPVGMDTLLVKALCHAASSATGVPVLPALCYTTSQGHTTKWPGTFSLRHETFISSLRDIAAWTAATGWTRLLLINTHYGNDSSARIAIDQLRLSYLGKMQVGLINSFHLSEDIAAEYSQDAQDLHANHAETSLMLYLYPDLVRIDLLYSSDDPDRTEETIFSYPVAQTSKNGVTGYPSRASAAHGEILFHKMTAALVKKILRAQVENPPLDAEYWKDLPHVPHV